MIDLDEWLKGLDEEDDREVRDNEEYQRKLFSEYVLRKMTNFQRSASSWRNGLNTGNC